MELYDNSNTFSDSVRSNDGMLARQNAAMIIDTHRKTIETILTEMELSREVLLESAWIGKAADKYAEVAQLWHEDALELQHSLTTMSHYLNGGTPSPRIAFSAIQKKVNDESKESRKGQIGYDYDAIDAYVVGLEDHAHQLHRERATIFNATESLSFDNSQNEKIFTMTRQQWNEKYTHSLSTLHRLRRGVDKARQNMLETHNQIKEMLSQPLHQAKE